MPKVVIIPKWEITKHAEDQGFTGTLVANAAYEATLKPAEGESDNRVVVFTIDTVNERPVKGDKSQFIIPNILFYEDGFREKINKEDQIDVRDIISLHTVYINRRFMNGGRRKSTDDDPFIFTFIDSKSNKPFDVKVDHDHFVGVTVDLGGGRNRTYIGFLDDINDDNQIEMAHLECYKGVFTVETVKFDASAVKGVFNYHLLITDFEETVAAKKANKKKKPAAPAKEAEETTAE